MGMLACKVFFIFLRKRRVVSIRVLATLFSPLLRPPAPRHPTTFLPPPSSPFPSRFPPPISPIPPLSSLSPLLLLHYHPMPHLHLSSSPSPSIPTPISKISNALITHPTSLPRSYHRHSQHSHLLFFNSFVLSKKLGGWEVGRLGVRFVVGGGGGGSWGRQRGGWGREGRKGCEASVLR